MQHMKFRVGNTKCLHKSPKCVHELIKQERAESIAKQKTSPRGLSIVQHKLQ